MRVSASRDIDNSQRNSNVSFNTCGRRFTANRGLLLPLNAFRRKQEEQQNQQLEANDDQEKTHRLQDMPRESINEYFYWDEKLVTTFVKELINIYDKSVYWRRNLLLLTTRVAGKVLLAK